MLKPRLIPELFVLRTVACLSLTLLHALNRIYPESGLAMDFVKLALTFGTPAFIFISEMILSYSYPDDMPKSFWRKRFSFVFMPYLLFGAFYAVMKAAEDWLSAGGVSLLVLWNYLWKHIVLGDYHGYFILIVFQFYLLHSFYNKYMRNISPLWVVVISLLVNLGYLAVFNFLPPPSFPGAGYIWSKMHWLPFAGWMFYFSLAYYCGRYYEKFKGVIYQYGWWSIPAIAVAGSYAYWMQTSGIINKISSKRVDMIALTVCLIAFICFAVAKMRKLPPFFVWLSRYSFGIYLLHPLLMAVLIVPLQRIPIIGVNWMGMMILFVTSVVGSILIAYLLNRFRWGPYLIGKTGEDMKKNSHPSQVSLQGSEKSIAT